jgi:hypothetical protein
MPSDEPNAPNPCPEPSRRMRSFSLKSEEAEAALCVPRDPWVWAGGLPREPRWPRPPEGVWVCADDGQEAGDAFGDWLGHVEAGRIGNID